MRKSKYAIKTATVGLFLFGILITNSCTNNFSDYNKPKYQASEEDMKGDNYKMGAFFPQMQDIVVPAQENRYQHCENLIGGVYARYMMTVKSAWSGLNFSVYKVEDKWLNLPFNYMMTGVYGPWNEIKKMTNGEGVNFAWAQILRVAAMHRLTDTYGPIPYSKVETGALTVPYDSQENVYKAMFVDLNSAISVLTDYSISNPNARPMAQYDIVYNGDFKKWVKFANSLKLRMAMRIRFADAILAKQMGEEALNHVFGVISSNEDNAAYQYAKINPLFVMWSSFKDTRVCADITCYMNGYEDPRREKYFQTSTNGGGYIGVRTGALNPNDDWTLGYSAPVADEKDKILWITASEVAFLKAEAALVGWSVGGTAEELYNQAIQLSFDQWGVKGGASYMANDVNIQEPYTDPNNKYSTAAVSTITIKWDETATPDTKLERIITQKWIALWPLGTEAWSEYRRTGYPKLFKVAQTVTPNILVANRIPFSPLEYNDNKENMPMAVSLLGGNDNYETPMWWNKK